MKLQKEIYDILLNADNSKREILKIIEKSSNGCGLNIAQTASLLRADSAFDDIIFETAAKINQQLNNKVITFYGVSYIHDFCENNCPYCGDSCESMFGVRKLLTKEEFQKDLESLMAKHDFKEICFLTGDASKLFNTEKLIEYLKIASEIYQGKIILNIPPLSVEEFRLIKEAIPNILQFRVFQETYDEDIYKKLHTAGPKVDFKWRLFAQERALKAGFDEIGLGVLWGLNDKDLGNEFEVLSMLSYSDYIKENYNKDITSISFPRLKDASGIMYEAPKLLTDRELVRYLSVTKLSMPRAKTIITCRESADFRFKVRPIVNIEDFGARPGPGGNLYNDIHFQMNLPDSRSGDEVKKEMLNSGYTVL